MAEKEYIERDAALKIADGYSLSNGCTLGRHSGIADDISAQILRLPAADVVGRSAYDQTKWERDIAMQQLAEAGIPFGGKVEVAVVVHARWITEENTEGYRGDPHCTACKYILLDEAVYGCTPGVDDYFYCPNCGAKMDGKNCVPRTEDTP